MCLKSSRSCSVKLKKTHEFSMGKKRSWFSLLKRLFGSEPKSKAEKKSNRWRWVFGRLKINQYPKIGAPQRILNEAREEQRKQAMAVAIATAAAAEAAVAAARAAAEVVHLTGVPQSYKDYEKRTRNLAAIKIQAAYRAHLARKALKALKGLVRLQAMVRGRIVRRRVINKMKFFLLNAKAQSQVQEARVPTGNGSCKDRGKKQSLSPKEEFEEKISKLRSDSRRNWDYSLFSREDMEALWLRKQEATLRRERMMKYSSSHRETRNDQNVEALITNKEDERWGNQQEQRMESETCRTQEPLNFKSSAAHSNFIQTRPKNAPKQDSVEELNSPFTLPRRSFCHAKQKSIGEESSLPNSPIFPTYMAATESAKAKTRSMSTPKQRLGVLDTCADDCNSPYKAKLSPWSSFNEGSNSTSGRRGNF